MITVTYICQTCENKPKFDNPKKMFAHLRDVHHLEGNPIRGIQTPTAFLDGRGWYSQVFNLQFGDVRITKSVTGEKGIQS